MTPDEIRQQLQAAQAASGLTVAEWADKSGVNKATIFRALSPGYQHTTSNKTLHRLLAAANNDGPQQTSSSPIREARELKGWSQAALAEMVGTSQQTIDRLERGETDFSRYREPVLKILGLHGDDEGGEAFWPSDDVERVRFIYHGVRGETRYPLKHWDDMSPAERGTFAAIYEVLKNRQRRVRGPSGKSVSYLLSPDELKAELDRPGRSQAALAREMGLDTSAINRIVNGKREVKAREVIAIKDYLERTGPQGIG